jgi:ribose transport system ATP-binding protein
MAGVLEGAEITEAEIMRYAAGIKQGGENERLSA